MDVPREIQLEASGQGILDPGLNDLLKSEEVNAVYCGHREEPLSRSNGYPLGPTLGKPKYGFPQNHRPQEGEEYGHRCGSLHEGPLSREGSQRRATRSHVPKPKKRRKLATWAARIGPSHNESPRTMLTSPRTTEYPMK